MNFQKRSVSELSFQSARYSSSSSLGDNETAILVKNIRGGIDGRLELVAGSKEKRLSLFRFPTVILLVLLICSVSMAQEKSESATDLRAEFQPKIDELVQPYLDQNLAIGFTIGIIKSGETAVYGYGQYSQSDTRVPDGGTIFEIGSVSKVFTGMLLADAVVQKQVTLDLPAQEILGDRATIRVVDDHPISLRHLSTHMSGLPRLPFGFTPTNADDPYKDYSPELLYQSLRKGKSTNTPGEKHLYSNFAVGMLGHLLSLENDCSYAELLRRRVADPLGMADTLIELSDEQEKRFIQGHMEGGKDAGPWHLNALAGAGGIRSSTNDMLKFIGANLNPPKSDAGKMVELAWKQQRPPTDVEFAMGLGWLIAKDGETRWHNGQTGGYYSMIYANRKVDSGVVLLSNTSEGELGELAESIMRLLGGSEEKPRVFEIEKGPVVQPEVLQRLSGEYEFAPGLVLSVESRQGNLYVKLTGQTWLRVYPKSDSEWFLKVVEASVIFDLDDEGPAASVRLLQNGGDQKAIRKKIKSE